MKHQLAKLAISASVLFVVFFAVALIWVALSIPDTSDRCTAGEITYAVN